MTTVPLVVGRFGEHAGPRSARRGQRLACVTATRGPNRIRQLAWAGDFLERTLALGVFLPGTPHVYPLAELDLVFELPEDLLQEQRLETYRLSGVKS